jgi:hypothetical protein
VHSCTGLLGRRRKRPPCTPCLPILCERSPAATRAERASFFACTSAGHWCRRVPQPADTPQLEPSNELKRPRAPHASPVSRQT